MKKVRTTGWLLALAMLATGARAQEITHFSVPTSLCAGTSATVTFGFRQSNNVVLYQPETTLGHSERIFLPDGVPCGTLGCSYQSPVTFDAFASSATITSVQDIKYVRLNMEHSYIGDIYINITCPDGRKADIMKFGGSTTATCSSSIPASARSWLNGNNVSEGTFFGQAYDFGNSLHKCDSTAYGNEPGIGWNYCWSNNTTSGYQYAHANNNDDGIIYRNGHAHGGRIDSSNVAAHTNFYHPDQSFASLVGCPLNGTWYIEVMDGYSQDNGYIFEWELALNENLVPQDECVIDSFRVEGYGVTMLNDSTFTISAPAELTHDTTVLYRYRIYNSCGEVIDTSALLTFHPNYLNESWEEHCERFTWHGQTFTQNANLTTNNTTAYGCDSVDRIHIVVHPGFHLVYSEAFVENDMPHTYLGRTFTEAVTDTLLEGSTIFGCDSNVRYSLTVYPNCRTDVYDTLCANLLPYMWHGHMYNTSAIDSAMLYTTHGADSVVILHFTVLPATDSLHTVEVIENDLPYLFENHPYYTSVDTLYHFTNQQGCDSTLHLQLTVWTNHSYTYRTTICAKSLPYAWHGHDFVQADSVTLPLTDVHGADSTVTLILSVAPDYEITVDTTCCDNKELAFAGYSFNTEGTHIIPLLTAEGCDSTIFLNLSILPHNEVTLYDTICASQPYLLLGVPYEPSSPRETLHFSHTNSYGCDSLVTLHLNVKGWNLQAHIRAVPEIVSLGNPEFQLIDVSLHSIDRRWLIEDRTETATKLDWTYPVEEDSLPVRLVAFSNDGCTDTALINILIDRAAIVMPNVFTPDQDINNVWQPQFRDLLTVETFIYTREGLLVAHLEGLDAYWDGTHDGEPCPQGVYVYNTFYSTRPRPEMMQKITGTILLLR